MDRRKVERKQSLVEKITEVKQTVSKHLEEMKLALEQLEVQVKDMKAAPYSGTEERSKLFAPMRELELEIVKVKELIATLSAWKTELDDKFNMKGQAEIMWSETTLNTNTEVLRKIHQKVANKELKLNKEQREYVDKLKSEAESSSKELKAREEFIATVDVVIGAVNELMDDYRRKFTRRRSEDASLSASDLNMFKKQGVVPPKGPEGGGTSLKQ